MKLAQVSPVTTCYARAATPPSVEPGTVAAATRATALPTHCNHDVPAQVTSQERQAQGSVRQPGAHEGPATRPAALMHDHPDSEHPQNI